MTPEGERGLREGGSAAGLSHAETQRAQRTAGFNLCVASLILLRQDFGGQAGRCDTGLPLRATREAGNSPEASKAADSGAVADWGGADQRLQR